MSKQMIIRISWMIKSGEREIEDRQVINYRLEEGDRQSYLAQNLSLLCISKTKLKK